MTSLHFVVPGAIDQRTGGYIYDRRIVGGLRALGWTVQVHELAGRFPQADELAHVSAAEAIQTISSGALLVIDGLALPVLRHRILTNFTAASEGITTDKVIDRLLRDTPTKEGDELSIIPAVAGG